MPLGRINGGLQGELPFAPTIRYSLPFAQSPVAIRHSLPLLSWLIATPTFSLPTFCLSSTCRLLVVYLSLTFCQPFALPFAQWQTQGSAPTIRHSPLAAV
jgi:hypothetical protein